MPKPNLGGKRLRETPYKYKTNNGEIEINYGDEFKTIGEIPKYKIKFVEGNFGQHSDTPIRSAEPNRIYGAYNDKGNISKLVFTDGNGKAYMRMDFEAKGKDVKTKGSPHIDFYDKRRKFKKYEDFTAYEKEIYNAVKDHKRQ